MPYEKMNEMIDLYEKYMELEKDNFYEYVLFSYQWWILVLLVVVLWTIWALLVDKRRILPVLLVGLFTGLTATILDDIGLNLMLWAYPYRLTYLTSHMDPVDMAIVPVGYMLLYQYASRWKVYIISLAALSIVAIIAETLFAKLSIYVIIQWSHWYSLPIYFAIGLFVKWLTDKLVKEYS